MASAFHSIDILRKGANGQYVFASFLESIIVWHLGIQKVCIDTVDILKLHKANGSCQINNLRQSWDKLTAIRF